MPYKLAWVTVDEVDFVEKNARYMTKEQFESLVHNLKKDKCLSSVPLLYKPDKNKKFLILSGNHRIKAAQEAGIQGFIALVIDKPLTRNEQIAIQLSHNAIQGQDDEQILAELWRELQDDLEAQVYSGISFEEIEKFEKSAFETIKEEPVKFEEISLLFLPHEIEELKNTFDDIVTAAKGKKLFCASIEHYNAILDGLIALKEEQYIINTSLAFFIMTKIINEYLHQKIKSFEEGITEGVEDVVIFRIGAFKKHIKKSTAKKLRKKINKLLKKYSSIDETLEALCGGQ